jgi:hypothetical protein
MDASIHWHDVWRPGVLAKELFVPVQPRTFEKPAVKRKFFASFFQKRSASLPA